MLARHAATDHVVWIFVLVTGAVACHGLTQRNPDGERDTVRTLFGCIALLFACACCSSTSWS